MDNREVTKYEEQGLSRLSKEKLVTIISNLQNMPTKLAMTVSEYIPDYFGICSETLKDIKSMHVSAEEKACSDAQRVLDALGESKKRWEICFNEAKTAEDKEKYSQKIEQINEEVVKLRKTLEEERGKRNKSYIQATFTILCLAGAAIGITIRVGKRK